MAYGPPPSVPASLPGTLCAARVLLSTGLGTGALAEACCSTAHAESAGGLPPGSLRRSPHVGAVLLALRSPVQVFLCPSKLSLNDSVSVSSTEMYCQELMFLKNKLIFYYSDTWSMYKI